VAMWCTVAPLGESSMSQAVPEQTTFVSAPGRCLVSVWLGLATLLCIAVPCGRDLTLQEEGAIALPPQYVMFSRDLAQLTLPTNAGQAIRGLGAASVISLALSD